VRGFYNVGPIMIGMEGPLTADYDPLTGSMVNGKWVVIEPNPPNQSLTAQLRGRFGTAVPATGTRCSSDPNVSAQLRGRSAVGPRIDKAWLQE